MGNEAGIGKWTVPELRKERQDHECRWQLSGGFIGIVQEFVLAGL